MTEANKTQNAAQTRDESHPREIRRALISVSNKTGLEKLAAAIATRGIEILSTGGTARGLREAGVAVTDVSEVTGFPEIMDGRVKTLHPKIHGGLLGVRSNQSHRKETLANAIPDIDLLVVNLYPFEETVTSGAGLDEAVENIDIGGPAMIRAAAKNHADVAVIVDTGDYDALLAEMERLDGCTSPAFRLNMAQKAFARTAAYDAAISNWLADVTADTAPAYRTIGGALAQALRYGENPHQTASFYKTPEDRPGVATAVQLQGKALSYNNLNDTDAAYECVAEFDAADTAAVAIVKHANPCGVALGSDLLTAYRLALRCDPVSAFGGIVAVNRPLDRVTAEAVTEIFTEVVIAPDADEAAKAVFARKNNLRLLLAGGLPDPHTSGITAKTVAGGLLVQSRDNGRIGPDDLKTVTKRSPSDVELADLLFAFRVAKHVKSNTIVYAKGGATVGIGAGQMSRVDAARIAASKAVDAANTAGEDRPLTEGSVAASDAFFPFPDGLLTVIEAGATAVIQPGGSMRDEDVINAADKAGVAMVFTGMRHFRH